MRCNLWWSAWQYPGRSISGVQRAVFGRLLTGRRDEITVTDPEVIATSGTDRHPLLRPAPGVDAGIPGTVFELTDGDLAAADDYEVDAYTRVLVPLRSGAHAWVYVLADSQQGASTD